MDKPKRKERVREIFILCAVGIALLIACYFVFFKSDDKKNGSASQTVSAMTTEENRLCAVLSEIKGVGKVNAYIHVDEEGKTTGVILIFEGADSLSVRMDVIDAASLALGVDKKSILIYKLVNE